MAAKNRISISFTDNSWLALERLSTHYQASKAEVVRTIVEEFIRENPNRFRLKTSLGEIRTAPIDVVQIDNNTRKNRRK